MIWISIVNIHTFSEAFFVYKSTVIPYSLGIWIEAKYLLLQQDNCLARFWVIFLNLKSVCETAKCFIGSVTTPATFVRYEDIKCLFITEISWSKPGVFAKTGHKKEQEWNCAKTNALSPPSLSPFNRKLSSFKTWMFFCQCYYFWAIMLIVISNFWFLTLAFFGLVKWK